MLGARPSGQIKLGIKASSGQRGCTPAYRELRPLPGLQSARGLRSTGPDLQGGPGPQGLRRLLLSISGALPTNGALAPQRLPAEGAHRIPDPQPAYRPVNTQGDAQLSLPHGNRKETAQSSTAAHGLRPRGQGSQPRGQGGRTPGPMTPGPTPLKGQGQGYPPDYRGSLQPPAESRGRKQPHLQGRPPQPGTSQQVPRSTASGLRPTDGPAGAWSGHGAAHCETQHRDL